MRRRSASRRLLLGFLPLLLLLASCATLPPAPPLNRTPETAAEIEALTAFRLALQDPLGALSGWNPALPTAPCTWRGVTCYSPSTPRVAELRLPRLRLSGPISPRISSLPLLRKLSLRSNLLAGPIPSSLSSLRRLRSLFLQYNSLSGPLLPLSNLSSLQILNTAGNRLSGAIPTSLPSSLHYLDLSSNSLSGVIPTTLPSSTPNLQFINLSFNRLRGTVPPSLGRLRSLLYLWLDWNLLEGTLPAALANCSALLHLSIQGNGVRGILPAAVGEIPSLQVLSLAHNRLSGPVPSSIFFNASKPPALRIVQLGFNSFSSVAQPSRDDLAASTVLQVLDIRENDVAGEFPAWLVNVKTLTILDISGNNFSGRIPPEIGRLSSLRELRVERNSMSGPVPVELGRCSLLQVVDLEDNRFSGEIPVGLIGLRALLLGGNLFSGSIPSALGNTSRLESLSLNDNQLTGGIPAEVLVLGNLTFLSLAGNDLSGEVPAGIGGLAALQSLNLSSNRFSGGIPAGIGKLSELRLLDLSGQKKLSGELPDELFGLPNLQVVSLADCSFSGDVPEGFSSLWSLQQLNLTGNAFSGSIPATYGYLASLQDLALSSNNISGQIPPELGNCSNLTTLQLRSNHLSGHIPVDLSRLSNLSELDLGRNDLSGDIPSEISECSSLEMIRLDGNHLSGSIPGTISNLTKLQTLDVSANSLTGTIPSGLARISGLAYLNASMNNLEGEIPSTLGARFDNPSLFSGNPNLCGEPLGSDCGATRRRKRSRVRLFLLIGLAAAGAIILTLLVCCCCTFYLLRWRRKFLDARNGVKKRSPARGSGSSAGSGENGASRPKLVMFEHKITYAETVEATRQFDEENVLSRGRHGLVFKACYNDGTVLSIQRLPSTSADGAIVVEEAFFRKEAEALGKVKHRNLTVLRGYYAGPPPDVRLLVYDYMPNGNLATLLQEASHQDGHILNWPMRHLIALGVARGLAFLHASNVVHGDVKPQNVLFDADFEPHLTDFGLERMVVTPGAAAASTSEGRVAVGSVGYVAPDAAAAGEGSREGDVYSFGIVLLELLTGRRPVMIGDGEEDIVKWVKRQLQRGQIAELLEPGLLELDPESSEWEEFLLGVKVGLLCTAGDPLDRPPMADVVFMLEGCRVGPDVPSSADPTSLPSPA